MTSSIYFKMHHGNQVEPINFTGHQITLLDLKRQVIERKNFKGLDFDLEIKDAENAKGIQTAPSNRNSYLTSASTMCSLYGR